MVLCGVGYELLTPCNPKELIGWSTTEALAGGAVGWGSAAFGGKAGMVGGV